MDPFESSFPAIDRVHELFWKRKLAENIDVENKGRLCVRIQKTVQEIEEQLESDMIDYENRMKDIWTGTQDTFQRLITRIEAPFEQINDELKVGQKEL